MGAALLRLAAAAVVVSGSISCGGSKPRVERHEPKSYAERMAEAAEHDRDAKAHERAATEASGAVSPTRVRCGHPAVGASADQSTSGGERLSTWVPCWSVEREAAAHHQAMAAEQRRQAKIDRGIARNMVQVEREFCSVMPPDELTHTAFYHHEDVARVEPYREGGQLRGARILFKPVEGLDANWMRQAILCHRARAATLGYDPKYMSYDPTVLADLHVAVTDRASAVSVVVRAADDVVAAVVLSRAQALLTHVAPSEPPPPAPAPIR